MSKQRATDTKLGGLHEKLAGVLDKELDLMVETQELDVQIMKLTMDFLKANNITSNIEDSPVLGDIQSSVIQLDESALPKGHDFKLVQEG